MIRFFLFALFLAVVGVFYAFRVSGGYKWIRGNGRVVTVQEKIDSHTSIVVHHGFDLNVIYGDVYDLKIDIDDNLIDYLDVYSQDGCLNLGVIPDVIIKSGTMKATVTTNNIETVKGSGATVIALGEGVVNKSKFNMKLSGASETRGYIHSDDVSIKKFRCYRQQTQNKLQNALFGTVWCF